MRVIDVDGTQCGVMSIAEALRLSDEKDMDLVEVSPNSSPPVCKIMDYGKFRYLLSKKHHQAKKRVQHLGQLKEIKMGPGTNIHDLKFKINHIKKFLESGHKVKVSIVFKGRQITHSELGMELLDKITEEIKMYGTVEQEKRLEGRNLVMIFVPKNYK